MCYITQVLYLSQLKATEIRSMKLTKQERQELENKKLALEVRNKRLDNLRLIIQIPLTTLLLGLAIIELIKFNN